jgi:hypothetical protein
MIRLGVETPAERNGAIYAYDETQRMRILGGEVNSWLNRYSLTGMLYAEVENLIPQFVEQLSEEFQLPFCYLTAWWPSSFSPAQLRLREKRHLDAGWSLGSYEGLRIAIGPDQKRFGGFGVEEFHNKNSYCVWVEPNHKNDLIEEGIWGLVSSFRYARSLGPDLREAGVLHSKLRALAYVDWCDSARAGIVLVTNTRVADNFWQRKEWQISEVLTGAMAEKAWEF